MLRADSTRSQIGDANELLKRAADLCSEDGEAWYYRSVVEEELGKKSTSPTEKQRHDSFAQNALKTAQQFSTEALRDKLNPFQLATPPPKSAPPATATPKGKWALVIGVGTFTDKAIEPLHYTVSDAQYFRDFLVDPAGGGFNPANVRYLVDGDATLVSIKESINWLARSAAPDDMVLVYVATHGSSRDLDTAGANYIITHDTQVGEKLNPDALYATALPMVELANAVATRFKAQRTAIFLDTCYSGGATDAVGKQIAPGVATASVSTETLKHMTQGTGRMIFAASRTDQESLESDTLKHGYFTYYLVNALRAKPIAPLTQIFADVEQKVSDRVKGDFRSPSVQQNPVMSRSSDATDFAVGTAATVARLHTPSPDIRHNR